MWPPHRVLISQESKMFCTVPTALLAVQQDMIMYSHVLTSLTLSWSDDDDGDDNGVDDDDLPRDFRVPSLNPYKI